MEALWDLIVASFVRWVPWDIVLASRLPSLGSCLHTTMSLRASVMPFERSGISSKRSAKRLTISEAYRVFTPVIDT